MGQAYTEAGKSRSLRGSGGASGRKDRKAHQDNQIFKFLGKAGETEMESFQAALQTVLPIVRFHGGRLRIPY